MRIKLASGLILVVGAVLAACLLLGNQTLNPLQLAQAKTACRECHAKPAFAEASAVHARHPEVGCATCHPASPPVADFGACKSCHGVPRYDSPLTMHDIHAALDCSHCHRDNAGLKAAVNLHSGLEWFGIGIAMLGLAGIAANFIIVRKNNDEGAMEQRTVERFRKRAIGIHWLHAASFVVLLITGALMFFHLTGIAGGRQIRTVHRITAVFFAAAPVLYSLFDPEAAMRFLSEAFCWHRDDAAWLTSSVKYYFRSQEQPMPPQDRINGDQKLWQLVVIITGATFVLTGIILWFFRLKVPLELYQYVLLAHAVAFIVISFLFPAHFYLRTLHPGFEESLSSMLDGKVSASYARKHYPKWHDRIAGENHHRDTQ